MWSGIEAANRRVCGRPEPGCPGSIADSDRGIECAQPAGTRTMDRCVWKWGDENYIRRMGSAKRENVWIGRSAARIGDRVVLLREGAWHCPRAGFGQSRERRAWSPSAARNTPGCDGILKNVFPDPARAIAGKLLARGGWTISSSASQSSISKRKPYFTIARR